MSEKVLPADDIAAIKAVAILNRTFIGFFSESLVGSGISYSEGVFLVNIGYEPGISQEGLAQELVIDKAAVARAVKSLKARKLVDSLRSEEDKRENKLFLTEPGKRLFRDIQGLNRRWVDYVTAGMPRKEVRVVFKGLSDMAEAAKGYPGDP